MTDIVDRLRNPGMTIGCPDCGAVALHAPTVTRDMAEAADEIERLRAKEKDWAECFDAQKSVIGRLTDTLHEIKRCNAQYNFGTKLVRLVDTALEAMP